MSDNRLYYLAAPLAPEKGETVESNLARAKRYLRKFNLDGYHTIAPWIGLVESLDEEDPEHRRLGMEVATRALRLCGGIILCGPRVSSGMLAELDIAEELDLAVIARIETSEEEDYAY